MNILLVQLSFLGDTILSTPVIPGIKQIHPRSRLAVMTTPLAAGLFENDPLVDDILVFDKRGSEKHVTGLFKKAKSLKAESFDRVYSLHRSHRTAMLLYLAKIPERIGFRDAKMSFLYSDKRKKDLNGHAALRNLSLLYKDIDRKKLNPDLRLYPPALEDLSFETAGILPESTGFIVMAPGSAWKTKQWSWKEYRKTCEHFLHQGLKVVLVGGKADMETCSRISSGLDVIDCSGKISLSETMYMISCCTLVICNDSMSLHMASAFKKPTVAVFCATSPAFGFGPWQNPKAVVVQDETLSCKPCRRHGSNRCPNRTESCMNLPAENVIQAAEDLV